MSGPIPDTPVNWQSASPANPCPICRKPNWCSVSPDGNWCCCRREPPPGNTSGQVKRDKNGDPYWVYPLTPVARQPLPGREPTCSLPDGNGELADPDLRHRVYSELLSYLDLSPAHQRQLQERGLSGDLKDAGYRILDKERSRAVQKLVADGLESHLPRVPGFFLQEKQGGGRYWTVSGRGGLLIPIRDERGRIVALSVRVDGAAKGKYRFVSSKQRGGPAPAPRSTSHCSTAPRKQFGSPRVPSRQTSPPD